MHTKKIINKKIYFKKTLYNICRVIINKQFKTKHYGNKSKTNIIRRITNYSLLGYILYNFIFYFIVMKNNIPQFGTKEFNDLCSKFSGKPKQETLEEVAERYRIYWLHNHKSINQVFIDGAKWQQEQDKNKYSEEDMINRTQVVFELTNKGYSIDEIIEQFKNK